MMYVLGILLLVSVVVVALLLYRFMGSKETQPAPGAAPAADAASLGQNLKRGLRFMLGPFPISITLHVLILLFLIITYHQQRGRELIMVNLEAGGGGGGGGDEMQDLDMPEVPMPDTAPTQMVQPVRHRLGLRRLYR